MKSFQIKKNFFDLEREFYSILLFLQSVKPIAMNGVIGRQEETKLLERYAQSGKAEFIALYGRRRVGKTFLINSIFGESFTFSMTSVLEGNKTAQMHAFADAMDLYGNPLEKKPKDWYDAFQMLRHFLMKKMSKSNRCIVFIDELPCFDTRQSDFTNALGYFWNSWASLQDNLMLIVCGSATSWMMENVIDSRGGLHNRITHEMHLKEFTLYETEQYLKASGFLWDRLLVLQTYMAFGGIPYYLSLLNKEESLAQNIDRLFFRSDGKMRREFHRLYKTLFNNPGPYITIMEALFNKKKGLSREEIAQTIGKESSGRLTKMLNNLVDCDLVRFYNIKKKKISKQSGLYQLTDFYTAFYLQFVKGIENDEHFWTKSQNTPTVNTWRGLAFERVCLAHIPKIKKALGIEAIKTTYYSWRSSTEEDIGRNAQIDLIIERADRMVNICEIKYSPNSYLIDNEEHLRFQNRMARFQQETAYSGGIIPVFVTPFGLQRNAYSEYIINCIVLDDLF